MPSEGSVHTLKFDTTDSSRSTAIALRLRERWLRLAQAPSSSPKFESDALLPCECRGALRRPERQSPGLLLRHVNRCQMTSPRLDVGEPCRNGQFGHVPPLRRSTTASVGALVLKAALLVSCCPHPRATPPKPPPFRPACEVLHKCCRVRAAAPPQRESFGKMLLCESRSIGEAAADM